MPSFGLSFATLVSIGIILRLRSSSTLHRIDGTTIVVVGGVVLRVLQGFGRGRDRAISSESGVRASAESLLGGAGAHHHASLVLLRLFSHIHDFSTVTAHRALSSARVSTARPTEDTKQRALVKEWTESRAPKQRPRCRTRARHLVASSVGLPYGIFLHPLPSARAPPQRFCQRRPPTGAGSRSGRPMSIACPLRRREKSSRSTGLLGATWLASLPYAAPPRGGPACGSRCPTHHATTYPSSLGEQEQGLREPRLTAVAAVA